METKKVIIPEDMGKTIEFGSAEADKWNVKVDGTTIRVNDQGQLEAIGGGGTPAESLYADVRLGLVANKNQVNEGGVVDLIYTITNTGSAAAAATLTITPPAQRGKRIAYAAHQVDKVKVANVNKTSDTQYEITGLEPGGAVSITIPTTFQDFGSFAFSGLVNVTNGVDKSADDNRAAIQIDVTTTRDMSYQPTQSCPALNIIDKATNKALLLMDYGSATYITNRNQFMQESPHQPATVSRLNVYSPNTTSITLRVADAGTAVVHGFYTPGVAAGMDDIEGKMGAGNAVLALSERSTGYEFNGKRYAVKPQLKLMRPDGWSEDSMLGVAIQRDKRTYFGSAPNGVTSNFANGELVINGLKPGTWLAVSFRPRGSNCEFQTVLISIPMDVTPHLPAGLRLTRTSGTASHVQISSSLTNRADVSTGYNNINGDISNATPIVALDHRQNDKAVINAPSGMKNVYDIAIAGGTVKPSGTSSGNVKIVPNAQGNSIKVTVEATATAADNFIYRNEGVVIEMKIA